MQFEFKVIPAPNRGEKAKGLKTGADRFSFALARVMNEMGADGWDYVRAETLPCEERKGLTGSVTVYHTMLVFRRTLAAPQDETGTHTAALALAPPVSDPAASVGADTGAAQTGTAQTGTSPSAPSPSVAAPSVRHAAPSVVPPRPVAAAPNAGPRLGAALPSWMRRGQTDAAPDAEPDTPAGTLTDPETAERR